MRNNMVGRRVSLESGLLQLWQRLHVMSRSSRPTTIMGKPIDRQLESLTSHADVPSLLRLDIICIQPTVEQARFAV